MICIIESAIGFLITVSKISFEFSFFTKNLEIYHCCYDDSENETTSVQIMTQRASFNTIQSSPESVNEEDLPHGHVHESSLEKDEFTRYSNDDLTPCLSDMKMRITETFTVNSTTFTSMAYHTHQTTSCRLVLKSQRDQKLKLVFQDFKLNTGHPETCELNPYTHLNDYVRINGINFCGVDDEPNVLKVFLSEDHKVELVFVKSTYNPHKSHFAFTVEVVE